LIFMRGLLRLSKKEADGFRVPRRGGGGGGRGNASRPLSQHVIRAREGNAGRLLPLN
jgi:hypothetical protein